MSATPPPCFSDALTVLGFPNPAAHAASRLWSALEEGRDLAAEVPTDLFSEALGPPLLALLASQPPLRVLVLASAEHAPSLREAFAAGAASVRVPVASPAPDGEALGERWPDAARCAVGSLDTWGPALAAGLGARLAPDALLLVLVLAGELAAPSALDLLRQALRSLPQPRQAVVLVDAWTAGTRQLAGEVLCDPVFADVSVGSSVMPPALPPPCAPPSAASSAASRWPEAPVVAPAAQAASTAPPRAAAIAGSSGSGTSWSVLEADAPAGSAAYMEVRFDKCDNKFLFRAQRPSGGTSTFQISLGPAMNDMALAERLCRLCYVKYEEGMSLPDLCVYRRELYQQLKMEVAARNALSDDGPHDGPSSATVSAGSAVGVSCTHEGHALPQLAAQDGRERGRAQSVAEVEAGDTVPAEQADLVTNRKIEERLEEERLMAKYLAGIICRSTDPNLRQEVLQLLPPMLKRKMEAEAAPEAETLPAGAGDEENAPIRDGIARLFALHRESTGKSRAPPKAARPLGRPPKTSSTPAMEQARRMPLAMGASRASLQGLRASSPPASPRDLAEEAAWSGCSSGGEEESGSDAGWL
eukprot:TRINITY_DN56258_c0_g1_i1.p1 TRINITY_DN56258_c0_g1~~TRINITY_DN56258_c0_g1_i1.p1  ORF type:complete len:587 (+),score=138.93 TRINITY_DN56258_c0_g1_i1:117-1877(+)